MNWLGDYPEDFTTVAIYFTTHDSNGAPVAPLTAFENTDVIIYKDGSGTQKTSANGLTMTSPFDSLVGLHCLLIDTSNDTGDAAWWVAGHVYTVVLSPDTETVNGQTVLKVIGTFGLGLTAAGSGLTAAGVRTAVGLATANLDTQLDALPTANENADALLDRSAGVETNRTPRQSLRLILAALTGKASGLATTTAVYRDTNDSKDRITATVDADGNRSAVTLDAS